MNIFVGNLASATTEEDLRQAFQEFGEVASVTIPKDRMSGQPRGFGFVEMPNRAEAQAALAGLNGRELRGRAMRLDEARPRPTGGDRGEGGGGRRYESSPGRGGPESSGGGGARRFDRDRGGDGGRGERGGGGFRRDW